MRTLTHNIAKIVNHYLLAQRGTAPRPTNIDVIFFGGLLLLCLIGCHKQAPSPDALRMEIDTRQTQPLRQELYGFNSNMMSGDYGYLDPGFVALTQALRPKTLRFPGGTVGNFYHWKTAGFVESEMVTTLSAKLNKRNKGNYVKLKRRRNGKIAFDDFMQLCRELSITPIVVVNLWTGSPEESAEWVQYAKTKGYEIAHWELGNEYYLPHYVNKYPTVETYIARAKEHAAAMKAVNPDIKLSVCATPVAFHKEGWLIKTYQRKWDEGLAADTSFYDAFTVHVYAYKAVRDEPIETMRGYLFGWIHFAVDEALDYYQELFNPVGEPSESVGEPAVSVGEPSRSQVGETSRSRKEMWITEWNIANPGNRVANTQLHAMYVGDFFLKMLSMPEVTQANFHVIAGPGKGFPVFSPITPPTPGTFWKYGGEPPAAPHNFDGKAIKRAVYPTFQLIGEAFSQADKHFKLTLHNLPTLAGQLTYKGKQMDGMQAHAVGDAERLFILISNRTGEAHAPQLVIDRKRFKGEVMYRYVANENLVASNGGNAEMEGSGEIEVRIQEWRGQADKLLIPKNSFGVIKVQR